jgi:hypothetical protein
MFSPSPSSPEAESLAVPGLEAGEGEISSLPVPPHPPPIAYSPSPLSGMLAKLSGSGYSVLALDAVRR